MQRHLLSALVLTLLFAGPILAQTDQTGVLRGSVVDSESGAAVSGTVVLATLSEGGFPKDSTSDDEGRFRMGFLTPGSYDLVLQAPGYGDLQITGVRVNAAQVREIEARMTASEEFTDVVTVVAEEALIDTSSPVYETTLDSDDVELLPVSRVATDLVKFTPGATNQSVWGGSTDQANSYQLDGVSVNQPGFGGDFLLPNVDWIEEFQVKGLGAGAEVGNFQGGLINIVTKSGSNAVQGGVRLNFENDSLAATNLNVEEAGAEQDQRWEASVDTAGALVKDSLYYFVSAQRTEEDTKIVDGAASVAQSDVVFLPVMEQREETKLFGKLTWQATDRDLVQFQIGWDDVETTNRGLDSFTAPEAALTQDSPAVFGNLSWSRTIGNAHFLELKVNGYDGDDDRLPLNGDQPAVQILGGNRDIFNNALHTRRRSPKSNAFSAALDSYLETGSVQHNLKIGTELELGEWRERRIRNGGFTWRPEEGSGTFDPLDASTWGFISSDWAGDINLDAETENGAVYVQDYLDLSSRVRLSAGIRYGWWIGDLTPGFGGGPSFAAVDDSAIDPRFGAVLDLKGDGSLIGKVHVGRYHQSLFALLFDRVEGGNVFQDLEYWDWVGPGDPDPTRAYTQAERDQFFELFRVLPSGAEVGPALDYEQPYVDQLVAGLEQKLGSDWKVGLTWVHRENENIVALVDRNLDRNYTLFRNISVFDFRTGNPVLDADGNPLVLPQLFVSNDDILYVGSAPGLSPAEVDALDFDRDFVLTNVDDADREMDQLQLVVSRAGADWSFDGSVVYTDLTGNFFSVSGYQNPGGTGVGMFVDPNEMTNAQGDLRGVDDLQVKLRLTGQLPWNLRGGVFALWASGEHYTPVYEIDDRNHDFVTEDGIFLDPDLIFGISGEGVFTETRGSRELDDVLLVDLHLDRIFPVGGFDFTLGLDVFNLLNDDAVTSVRTLVNDQDPADPTTLFGSPRGRTSPRTARLYASFRW